MNSSHWIPSAALAFLCAAIPALGKHHPSPSRDAAAGAALDNIFARTSVRSYAQGKAVEREKIEQLLRCGMAAPSAMNKQPWHFVVVTDRATLDALGDANPNAKFVKQAPLAIVVCGDLSKTLPGVAREFWAQDCSAATENILLAATALGLGATWTGGYPIPERIEAISKVLSLPETMVPLDILVIGYPDKAMQPKDKWNPANVSWQVFGGKE